MALDARFRERMWQTPACDGSHVDSLSAHGRAHSALAVRAGSARCCAELAAVYLLHARSMQSSAFGVVALERLHVEVVR
jgi:hypothetical protein